MEKPAVRQVFLFLYYYDNYFYSLRLIPINKSQQELEARASGG
jgi:hypothetical protein